jgi:hypothetical protein
VRQLNVTTFLGLAKALGCRTLPELPPWSIGLGWLQVRGWLIWFVVKKKKKKKRGHTVVTQLHYRFLK